MELKAQQEQQHSNAKRAEMIEDRGGKVVQREGEGKVARPTSCLVSNVIKEEEGASDGE